MLRRDPFPDVRLSAQALWATTEGGSTKAESMGRSSAVVQGDAARRSKKKKKRKKKVSQKEPQWRRACPKPSAESGPKDTPGYGSFIYDWSFAHFRRGLSPIQRFYHGDNEYVMLGTYPLLGCFCCVQEPVVFRSWNGLD